MFRTVGQKQILFVTVNRRERAFRQIHTWRGPPEVYAVILAAKKIF
jgi:hypothetical protein